MRKLIKYENGKYSIKTPLLLLFSLPFVVWQMGIVFYSGTTMSLFGRTPIAIGDTTAVIVAGYLASIAALCLFPRKAVYMERVLLPVALLSTLLLLLPLPAWLCGWLFNISAFVCVFSIGTMASLAAQQFTLETTWRDGILSMAVGGVLIALLQNELFPVSATAFLLFSLLLIAALTVFHYAIPAKIDVPYAKKGDFASAPRIIFFGLWLISSCSTLLLCFASSFAESVPHGVSALYLSAAAAACTLFVTRKKLRFSSVRMFGAFFAVAVLGFAVAGLSLYLPGAAIIACVLLGFSALLANLWIFFAAASFSVYPLRFVGAVGALSGLILMLLHSGLLSALRDDLPLLYGLYAALSVALLILYLFLEPYFTYALKKREEQKQVKPQAADGESIPAFRVLSEQERRLALLILSGHTETSVARAMNISVNTQKGYRKNLYSKLNIHSKRELFELAGKDVAQNAPKE